MIAGIILGLLYLGLIVFMIASAWKIFAKAGEPGWACLIPIYSTIVLLKIVGRPWWWLFLFIIPFVGLIFAILVAIDTAKSFGKSGGFAVGLLLLPFVFYPILGWGSATYQGPANTPTPA